MGRVRRYDLLERIGIGGMAEIYRARAIERDGKSSQICCVKKILPHLSGDPEYRQMFMDEARVAFALHHPNIVQMFDLGRMDEHLFLALEFVDGADLQEVLLRARDRATPLPLAALLHIAIEILKGLHYAHSRRTNDGKPMAIVHRDVAPGNVLVSRTGDVKLGDFGIARAAVRAGKTVAGVVKGNALYMAPEQITGAPMDPRTDVYGAGLLLLTLLCGKHPYERETLPRLIDFGVTAAVPDPSSINPSVPKELDAIVAKATELDPGKRYATAMEMGMAMEAYAREAGLPPGQASLAAALIPLVPDRAPDPPAEDRPTTYVGPVDPVTDDDIPLVTGRLVESESEAPEEVEESVYRTYVGPLVPVLEPTTSLGPTEGEDVSEQALAAAIGELEPSETAIGPRSLEDTAETRPKKSRLKKARADPRERRTGDPTTSISRAPVENVVTDPTRTATVESAEEPSLPPDTISGKHPQAAAGDDLELPEPDLDARGEPTREQSESERPTEPRSTFRPPELDAVTRTRMPQLSEPVAKPRLRFGGKSVAPAGPALPPDADSGPSTESIAVLEGHRTSVAAVAFLSATRAASAGFDQMVRVWDTLASREVRSFRAHPAAIISMGLSADGELALTGSRDKTLRLWELGSGSLKKSFSGHEGWVFAAAIGPDKRHFISGGQDKTVRLWEIDKPGPVATLEGHRDSVVAIAIVPGGARAISASYDRSLRVWDLASGEQQMALEAGDSVRAVAISADGRRVASGGADSRVTIWDLEKGTVDSRLSGHREPVVAVAFSPDGSRVLSGSYDATLRLWEVSSGRTLSVLRGHTDPVLSCAFAPDGRHAISGSGDGTVRLWDLE